MSTAAQMVDTQIASFNATLDLVTDPDEMDEIADSMETFVARYFSPAQGSQVMETAANLRARAAALRDVVLLLAPMTISASLPAATTFTD